MYQIEIKRFLIEHKFRPSDGWTVFVDVDAMELGKGSQQRQEKVERAAEAVAKLRSMEVNIGKHPEYGRVDIFARHPKYGEFIVEVEGLSSKQKEQAMYSALGQLVLQMCGERRKYILAVPDDESWRVQLKKIPDYVHKTLNLSCWLVSDAGVQTV